MIDIQSAIRMFQTVKPQTALALEIALPKPSNRSIRNLNRYLIIQTTKPSNRRPFENKLAQTVKPQEKEINHFQIVKEDNLFLLNRQTTREGTK